MGLSRRLIQHTQSVGACAKELVSFALGRRYWVRVEGESMMPALNSGDCVLINPALAGQLAIDQIVVVNQSDVLEKALIKRVSSFGENSLALKSDNPNDAVDSRHFGSIKPSDVAGRATMVFRQNGLMKRI